MICEQQYQHLELLQQTGKIIDLYNYLTIKLLMNIFRYNRSGGLWVIMYITVIESDVT